MKKVIYFLAGSLIILAALFLLEKKESIKEVKAETEALTSPASSSKKRVDPAEAQQIMQAAKTIISTNSQNALSNQDLETKIEDIERVLESSNAIERMNDETLDLDTRQQFIDWIETKQKLLSILIDREIKASQELLERRK